MSFALIYANLKIAKWHLANFNPTAAIGSVHTDFLGHEEHTLKISNNLCEQYLSNQVGSFKSDCRSQKCVLHSGLNRML